MDESPSGNPETSEEFGSLDVPPLEGAAAADALVGATARVRRRPRVITLLIVAAVAAVTLALVTGLGGPGTSQASAFVASGARATLAEGSADLTLSGSFSSSGQTFLVSGSGVADFAHHMAHLAMTVGVGSQSVQEDEIVADATMYLSINVAGKDEVAAVMPGKHWVTMTVPVTSASRMGSGTSNPISQLMLLAHDGNTVTSLGASTIGGEAVTGYRVQISRAVMASTLKALTSSRQYNAAARRALLMSSVDLSPPVIDVWIGSDGLLHREVVEVNYRAQGTTASGRVQVDLSNFGTSATVTPPPPGEVVSMNDFSTAAAAALANG